MESSATKWLRHHASVETGLIILVIGVLAGTVASLGTHYFGHSHLFAAIAGGLGAHFGLRARQFLGQRRANG